MADAAAAARDRRELAWQFNLLPSLYCHDSWLPAGLPDTVRATRHDPGALCHRQLSPWLLARCHVAERFEFGFDDAARRLALLDGAALSRLAPALGLLVRREALRRTVHGPALAGIRQACGLESLGFVVMSAGRFSLHGPSGGALDPDGLAALPLLGRQLLTELASHGQWAVAGRLRLKFGRGTSPRAPRPAGWIADGDAPALMSWVADQLIPKVVPQWAWLFC